MSLQVNDPRSRGRSKSPSGRTRERSTSRAGRVDILPAAPMPDATRKKGGILKKYADDDSADENLRVGSRTLTVEPARSRGSSAVRTGGGGGGGSGGGGHRRTNSRYGVSSDESEDSEDARYRRRDRNRDRDRYDVSDVGEGSKYSGRTVSRDDQRGHSDYARSHRRQTSQYDDHLHDSESDSDSGGDDALAYGDLPGKRRNYRLSSSPRGSASKLAGIFKGSSSSSKQQEELPGAHPSYALPGQFRYAQPVQPPYSQAPPSDWGPIPECELPGFVPPSSHADSHAMPGAFPTIPATGHGDGSAASAPVYPMPHYMNPPPQQQQSQSHAYTNNNRYANPAPFQYAQVDPNVKYASKSQSKSYGYSTNPQFSMAEPMQSHPAEVRYSTAPQFSKPVAPQPREQQYVEITPGRRTASRPHSLSVSSANNLSVAGPDPSHRPPASPLLEPYKGTYQSISPMPSPIVVGSRFDDDLSDMEPLDGPSDADRSVMKHIRKKSKDDRDPRKERKDDRTKRDSSRVRHERQGSSGQEPDSVILISPGSARKRVTFYDPVPDATAMQAALSHTRNMDTKTLIRILPHLGSDEILDLRKEYKNHVKLHGKGINIAKHLRLKLGTGSFGKVCYVTALGRWESEAHWANCYYQSSNSRRELLIESLIGRSNAEIREIKECFRDPRYLDNLEKCMKAELKADKFRVAVLLALEEKRQSERDVVDADLVQEDVQELHRALVSRDGGETAMIYIIVRRSDSHLREVLHAYEKIYKRNFAREMIAKSRNLVGETLAHILNGAINRPMRDALLLHQALRESRTGKERSELLISRLVRLHWEPRHLERVKSEFRKRYGERVEEAIAEEVLSTSGGSDWGEFCIELARSSSSGRRG